MSGQFLIYGLTDPRTNAVRYIGQSTCGTRRPESYKWNSVVRSTHNPRLTNMLRKWERDGLEYGFTVLQFTVEGDQLVLDDAEQRWIASGRAMGWDLVNVLEGGNHPPSRKGKKQPVDAIEKTTAALFGNKHTLGYKHTEEWKEAARVRMIGNQWAKGCKRTPEEIAKLRGRMMGNKYTLGRKHTPEELVRQGIAATGRRHTAESKAKISVHERRTKCWQKAVW